MFEQIGYSPGVFFAAVAGAPETLGGAPLLLLGLFTPLACSIVIGVMINAGYVTWSGGCSVRWISDGVVVRDGRVAITCTGAEYCWTMAARGSDTCDVGCRQHPDRRVAAAGVLLS